MERMERMGMGMERSSAACQSKGDGVGDGEGGGEGDGVGGGEGGGEGDGGMRESQAWRKRGRLPRGWEEGRSMSRMSVNAWRLDWESMASVLASTLASASASESASAIHLRTDWMTATRAAFISARLMLGFEEE